MLSGVLINISGCLFKKLLSQLSDGPLLVCGNALTKITHFGKNSKVHLIWDQIVFFLCALTSGPSKRALIKIQSVL